jgi:hypothetical protein
MSCTWSSLRRFADVARLAGCRGEQGRPSSCHNIDAENGDRSDLSQAQHIEACARSSHLSVSAARIDDQSAEPRLGDRHQLHPDGARLRLSHCRDGLVHTTHPGLRLSNTMEASSCIDAVEEAFAKHGCLQIFNADQGSQFTSTEFTSVLITTPSRSAWTARAHGETTFLSSAFGEPSTTRKSICVPMMASKKHGNQSAATSPSTTQGDLTQPLTAAPRIKPTLTRCRSARQHNPRPTIHLTTRRGGSQCRRR